MHDSATQSGEGVKVPARVSARRLRGYFIALLMTGGLLALCYPHPGWGLLAHIALVPAGSLALRAGSVRRFVWTSYVVSVLWWLFMLRWLFPVTGNGLFLLALFMGIYLPLTLIFFRMLNVRWHLPAVVSLPMAVVTFELVRTYWPAGGFAWFMLGHTPAPYAPGHGVSFLIQLADVFGEHGVSFVIAMTNGMIIDVLTLPWMKPQGRGPARMSRKLVLVVFAWAVTLGGAMAYGLHRIGEAHDTTRPSLRIAVIQTDVPHSNKTSSSLEQLEADWQDLVKLTTDAAGAAGGDTKPDLIVWPETVVPGPVNAEAVQALSASDDEHHKWFGGFDGRVRALARQLAAPLLVGSPSVIYEPYQRQNSVYLYHATGQQAETRYDKIHRVPFGEYIPWVEAIPLLKRLFVKYISPYESDYTIAPGSLHTVFKVDQTRLVTPICFEDAVARLSRRLVYDHRSSKRADVLINLTNDAWYTATERPQHLQIAVFRSIENRVPTARSVNTGVSGFISSTGLVGPIVAPRGSKAGGPGFAIHQVEIDSRLTLFGRIGHSPAIVVAALTTVLFIAALFGRKKKVNIEARK